MKVIAVTSWDAVKEIHMVVSVEPITVHSKLARGWFLVKGLSPFSVHCTDSILDAPASFHTLLNNYPHYGSFHKFSSCHVSSLLIAFLTTFRLSRQDEVSFRIARVAQPLCRCCSFCSSPAMERTWWWHKRCGSLEQLL